MSFLSLYDNSILSISFVQHPVIPLCTFCSVRNGLYWIPYYNLINILFLHSRKFNLSVISSRISMMPWIHDIQNQTFFTLCWRSFSWWGNMDAMHSLACKGYHYFICKLLPYTDTSNTQDARQKIIDSQLTLNFRMVQEACCYCFCL